jgi:hypothetical protein
MLPLRRRVVPTVIHALACLALAARPAPAQEAPLAADQHDHMAVAASAWRWRNDANAFFGFNYQHRKFTDFRAWESQNWFMLAGDREVRGGHLSLTGMASLEPFTLKALGSPQVFQTGEAYHGAPLIDYQHPHDLLMQLGATYRREARGVAATFGADLVGSPAIGPTPFMHRASARNNPTVPLTHHYLDSTHITTGVVRGGLGARGATIEASVFRGEEPNENRLNIDRPRLNSWSVRGGWRRGAWSAQLSGARLHQPESYDPFDITRLTASIEFAGTLRSRPVAGMIAWGENREIHGTLDGYLLEWDAQLAASGTFYGRGELAAKDVLGLGSFHPKGFIHFHPISRVAAGTLGFVWDLPHVRRGRLGLGGDVTAYHVSENLLVPYGAPLSVHLFLRWRPTTAPSHEHLH